MLKVQTLYTISIILSSENLEVLSSIYRELSSNSTTTKKGLFESEIFFIEEALKDYDKRIKKVCFVVEKTNSSIRTVLEKISMKFYLKKNQDDRSKMRDDVEDRIALFYVWNEMYPHM